MGLADADSVGGQAAPRTHLLTVAITFVRHLLAGGTLTEGAGYVAVSLLAIGNTIAAGAPAA